WTTAKFRNENPKIYAAFVAALDESMKIINGDKKAAAEAYLRLARSKLPLESVEKLLNDPKIVFTTTPQGVTKYADFMYKVGSVKVKPESWKDLFFPNAYNLPGS
ncbi:MAG: ABC transporter substrate-binding protein, partial [Betaproteobacteria bacterium]|nr:ABC transporter substrate-binding protein [Betaproteobacteria bacterium]